MDIYDATRDPYLKVLRPLVETYQAVLEVAGPHIRSMGLTPAQFDVLAELGDTEGLTAVELSRATLLAKASLTGIIDRMEEKGLVQRCPVPTDRRATCIRLTKAGEALHRRSFPEHARYMRQLFKAAFSAKEASQLQASLGQLRDRCREEIERRREMRQ